MVGQGAEFAGAAFDCGRGDLIGCGGGFCAWPARIGEDMEVGEGEALDEGEGGGVVGFGFAWEAGDYVGADGGVGQAVVDEFDAPGVVLSAVPAVHGGEDAVGGGLERHMEMLGDAVGAGEEFDEILGDIEGLDGADAEAFDWGFIKDAADQVDEFYAGGEVAAVGA